MALTEFFSPAEEIFSPAKGNVPTPERSTARHGQTGTNIMERSLIRPAAVITGVAIASLVPLGAALIIGLTFNEPQPAEARDHSILNVSTVAEALYTPCPTEDSDNCYWDATARGNGQGTSFVRIDGNVFYDPTTEQLTVEQQRRLDLWGTTDPAIEGTN